MGKYYPQNALHHDDRGVVNFGAKPQIALTGVRSRVRESLAKVLISLYFFTETCLFPCKKCFLTV